MNMATKYKCGDDRVFYSREPAIEYAANVHRETGVFIEVVVVKARNYTAVRQTSCRHCELDIEGFAPYRKGEWRDRGSNTTCNDGKHKHAPYLPL